MTAADALRQACLLLNYTDHTGGVNAGGNADLNRRALPLINQIYADLWQPRQAGDTFAPLTATNQALQLEESVAIGILPYGVAMLLAQTEGDGDNQTVFARLYNQKRSGAIRQGDRIGDRLPRPWL